MLKPIHNRILEYVRAQNNKLVNGPIIIDGFDELELLTETYHLKNAELLDGEFAPNPNFPDGYEWDHVYIPR